jgi:amino acid adenylation domain-containing protein/non-ribosomal peptide synthase protein (TIGR01720 family)
MTDELLSGLDPEMLALLWADESADPIIKKQNHTEGPLSFSQHQLWVLQQLDPEMTAYNMPRALLLDGPLNTMKLEGAFKQLINKQAVFRTQYLTVNDLPIQRIADNIQFELESIALELEDDNLQSYLHNETVKSWFNRPFDLTSGALLRAAILTISDNKNIVLIDYHHIASDAWSNGLILQDLADAYAGKKLTALDTSYLDFAYWQNDYLTCDDSQTTKDYWLTYLSGDIQPLTLPIDFKQPTNQNFAGACSSIVLDEEKINDLKGFCQLYEVTPFMVLFATWQILLSRNSNQSDFAIGVPTASRNQAELQQIVGFFVNTQVYKAQLSPQLSVKELIEQIRNHTLSILEQEQLPLEWLLNNLEISRSSNRSPLFQVLFDYKTEESLSAKMDDIVITPFEANTTSSKLELELNVLMEESQAQISLNYQTALFTQSTIENLLEDFSYLLTQVISKPLSHVGNLTLRTPGSVLTNESQHKYTAPVHKLIEQQVELMPNAIALVFEEEQLTYVELNQRANQLAHYLISQGVKPEDKVGIAVERSIDMVVSLLAVLKAGCAFVPLDPSYPQERLTYMIEDSGLTVLLSQSELAQQFNQVQSVAVVYLDALALFEEAMTNPEVSLHQDNLAYLIYTSGSTGKPKAVAISHSGFAEHILVSCDFFSLTAKDRMLQFSTINFDGFIEQMFPPLTVGAGIVLRGSELWDGETFYRQLINKKITVTDLPTAYGAMLIQYFAEQEFTDYGQLREIHFGGEAMSPESISVWKKANLENVTLLNTYGPTEAVVTASVSDCVDYISGKYALPQQMPIGSPLAGRDLYVLDAGLTQVPTGVAGELCIGGELLARGYLGRADLTSSSFIADPFCEKGGRLYRTGDLVRWNNNGELEYLGRIDHQVKIRGFRIELGEIESELLKQEKVSEAVVVAQEHQGNARLVAYVSSNGETNLDVNELKATLGQSLPDYMVPSIVVLLDSLPLNPSGKVDRKALPEPEFVSNNDYQAAEGEVETCLAQIWCEVLGLEQVGRHDNFFELGGDSISILKVVAKTSKNNIHLTPRLLFEQQSIAALSEAISCGSQLVEHAEIPRLSLAEKQGATLSFAQTRQWFLWQLSPESTAYHISGGLNLTGELNVNAFKHSFNGLVARHESLRTIFSESVDGSAYQVIQANFELDIQVVDLSTLNGEEQVAAAKSQALAWHETAFDLMTGPLLRVGLIQLAVGKHILVVVMHHIISDGWSMQVLVNEFVARYQAEVEGTTLHLPELPIQYVDYAVWQRNWLEAGELEKQLTYWRGHLGDEQPVLQLPTDNVRLLDADYIDANHGFTLPTELSKGLKKVAGQYQSTLFMILLAAYKTLLYRYTGQEDIRIGVPIANRHRSEVENVIGFFVNTQVLRGVVNGRMPLSEVLQQARATALGAQEHQDLPFEKLVEALQPGRSLSHTPLFQVMYNHQRSDDTALAQMPGLNIEGYELGDKGAQFELTLDTTENAEGEISVNFGYAKELFNAETIARLSDYYLAILTALVETPAQAIGDIELLTEIENKQLTQWGINDTRYNNTQPVHQLIEQQVELTPNATALVFEDEQLTYTELNQRANQLAHYLIAQGVKPEDKVGIAVERSIEMVVSLLAVLKAGGAFVPLDPSYPQERLAYMIADSGLTVLLSQSELAQQFSQIREVTVCYLDALTLVDEGISNPEVSLHQENLAYLIYTSGSTGKPKAVAISQSCFAEHILVSCDFFSLTAKDRMLQFSTINFDGFIEQMFPPLTVGAAIVLRGSELWDGETFYRQLINKKITVTDLPTAYGAMLIQYFAEQEFTDYGQLREIHFGGEAMSPESINVWQQANLENITLLNTYGPTEAVVTASVSDCADFTSGAKALPQQMPIGVPLAGRDLYVLDAGLTQVPAGVAGELCIGGDFLARGYLGRQKLTAQSFIADPFNKEGGRLYRTGDLVRWNKEGELEYLGRIDHQVKIRGFRIELGEIESELLKQKDVSEAVVVAKASQSGARLIAYVAASADSVLDTNELKVVLGQSLPDYMVPSVIVLLDTLPLNPNGKIDRKALPEPEFVSNNEYAAPEGEVETQLAKIWCEVLGIEQVGRHDNFFELGGDSILTLQIVARMRQSGWKISPKQLFEHQTVSALAGVAQSITCDVEIISKTTGAVPLLPIQADFFSEDMPNRHHWNQSVLLHSKEALDIDVLSQAVVALVQQHDGLRLNYSAQDDGSWLQRYAEQSSNEPSELLWLRQANNADEVEALCNEAQRSLDISKGPLLRALAIELPDNSWRVLLAIHHLVVDGVSWRILLGDLQTAYLQIQNKQTINLPLKSSSYLDWSAALASYPQDNEAELSYWKELNDVPCALPIDNSVVVGQSREEKDISLSLSKEDTTALLTQAPAAYRTQVNDLLLTALGRALCDWSGDDSILIDLEGHGREDLFDHIDLSNTVGWFTSLYPVALAAQGSIGNAIKRVKESLRSIPNKGLGYGLFKSRGSAEQQASLQAIAKPQVVFNYLGQFDTSFDESAMWQVADESSGDSIHCDAPQEHTFSVNGQVYDGQLTLSVSYNRAQYSDEIVSSLVTSFKAELEAVISHCSDGEQGVTPSDFPLANIKQVELDALPLTTSSLADLYPLSPMQSGMLFHSLYEPEGSAYLTQLCVDIEGLDVAKFKTAWQAVIARHDILRTGFIAQGDHHLQWVAKQVELPFIDIDWRKTNEKDVTQVARDDLAQGFDLSIAPLMRLTLVQLTDNKYHLVWTCHHLLLDGWSTSIVMGEVLRHYAGDVLPAITGHYRDYIGWLVAQDSQATEVFWREQLTSLEAPTRLVNSLPPQETGVGYDEVTLAFNIEQTAKLNDFTKATRITMNTLVQGAWSLLLSRYCGQSTVAFGGTVAGRPDSIAGINEQVGLFINTLPVIVNTNPAQKVGDWLQALQSQNITAREYEYTQLSDVQRWAGHGGEGIFDSIVVFENYPVAEALKAGAPDGLVFGEVDSREETNYPLTLTVTYSDKLIVGFDYDAAHYEKKTIEQLGQHLSSVLVQVIESESQSLGAISIVSDSENKQLTQWGVNETRYDSTQPVHQLIEQQVELNTNAIALVFEDEQLTYTELNQSANQLAHYLIAQGIKPEDKVGIAVERSIEMVVSLLAVLKAGAAYVPIDPELPQARIEYIIESSELKLLLSQSHLSADIAGGSGGVSLAMLDELDITEFSAENIEISIEGGQLAYVIYTSGSTGKPKGVANTHGALHNRLAWMQEAYSLTSEDKILQKTPFGFDVSVWEFFWPLMYGAQIVVTPVGIHKDPEALIKTINQHQISTLHFVPSMLQAFIASESATSCTSLTRIVCSGEALPAPLQTTTLQKLPQAQLYNLYGPTEAAIDVTHWTCDGNGDVPVPIGAPISATSTYVLDSGMNLVPQGSIGELYLGGAGLARGYLNRTDLTSASFIANPFSASGERLYRTGDLVHWNSAGALEYQGRIDHQVKIRGFRIELGEIESELLKQNDVYEAVVIAQEHQGNARLVAYIATKDEGEIDTEQIQMSLLQVLPNYMVPALVIVLKTLPITPNGKVDRKALPEPEFVSGSQYQEPEGEVEVILANIWTEVLEVEKVGRHDNFFELGGHSLTAMQVSAMLNKRCGYEMPIRYLFEAPELKSLALLLPQQLSEQQNKKTARIAQMASLFEEFEI